MDVQSCSNGEMLSLVSPSPFFGTQIVSTHGCAIVIVLVLYVCGYVIRMYAIAHKLLVIIEVPTLVRLQDTTEVLVLAAYSVHVHPIQTIHRPQKKRKKTE